MFSTVFLCSNCQNMDAIVRSDPQIWETSVFNDPLSSAQIKIKKKQIEYNSFWDRVDADISYVVTIYNPLETDSSSQVVISFLDNDGFEVAQRNIGWVVGHFQGDLRGSISLPYKDCKKIKQATLGFYKPVK